MATILESLLKSCANQLHEIINNEAILILGVEEELEKVRWRVEQIQYYIDDAEKRRTTELAVNNWLGQLRDVIYDVDEILDVARSKGSNLLSDHPSLSSSSESAGCKCFYVPSFLHNIRSRHDVALRIRSLNKKIETISKDRIFSTFDKSAQPSGSATKLKLIRSSNLVEPNLVGKEIIHSSRKLVDLVLAHKHYKSYKLAIVGTGGVGKTTLAQKIYNDQKIKGSFKIHAWISVSQDYNEVTLLKEVLRNVGVHHEQGETIGELQRKLAETIEGKSFFLVLDDLWQSSVWTDLLRTPLHATTAVVLVTTRYDKVTLKIGVENTHRVDLMSEEVGWELLWKSMNIDEEKDVHNLRNIGIDIVRKCGFLPLAIKVSASVLASTDRTENEWKKILSKYACSQVMLSNEIEEALYLSYDELPHRLKQCFLYCALYVEDSAILRRVITRLWIAEGFIEEQQGQLLEDTAEEYYYELIHRNLLQPDNGYFDQAECKMHDLLRQLALSISKDECFIGDVETLRGENMSKLRRVTAVNKKDKLVLPVMNKVEVKVRTFFTGHGPRSIEDTFFKKFLLLRVLVLNYSLVESIPDYIGKLIHLRLLDLDYAGISFLPESIRFLHNLQILSLNYCDSLHSLPSALTQLYSLRCLSLLGTKIYKVPKGIGKLKFLNDLRGFPVAEGSAHTDVQEGWKLEELSSMWLLRYLKLVRLERASHCSTDAMLRDKTHLKSLVLEWTPDSGDVSSIEEVFKQLEPPSSLETLYIVGFFGTRYPKWFGTTCLSSLIHLILSNLRSCMLPPVGQLPNLKYLKIEEACEVTKVGPEFVGYENGDPRGNAFRKLEWLIMTDMPNWEEWSLFDEEEAIAYERGKNVAAEFKKEDSQFRRLKLLPRLVKLRLVRCPKLRALPRQLGEDTASLKHLELAETNNLKTVENFPLLSEILVINKCEGLEKLSNLPQVSELHVNGCPNLSHVDGLGSLRQLWLGEDMQVISRSWVPGLQMQHQQLHGEELDVYTMFSS